MTRLFTPLLINCIATLALSGSVGAQTPLDYYLKIALDSNLVLRQKEAGLAKSLLALQEAKSYFLPAVSLGGQYTLARGGRFIDIPVGDLMNPVYSTLNQLTGTTRFPQIENVSEQFLPNNFYDVRVRTSYPLFNPDLRYNEQIKAGQAKISEQEIAIYKRELIKEVKTAYYTYLLAQESVRIYQNTAAVVQRGLQVNESLYKNGKGLPAYISRSEAEVQQVLALLQAAENEARKAKAWFNFLLNRPLEDSVTAGNPILPQLAQLEAGDTLQTAQREERDQLKATEGIQRTLLKMQESFRKPRVSTFLDLGAQGFDFKVNDRSAYYLAGLQVDLPLFQGKRNLYRIGQTKNEIEQVRTQQDIVSKQLELAAFSARNNVLTALAGYQASLKQVSAAAAYFKLIDRGRTEGTNSFIEWLDARNQLTTAEIQQEMQRFKTLIAMADYERQTASVIIPE